MSKPEILWNEKINGYTLDKEIDGQTSIKKIPLKFKADDKTSKFRKEILKENIFNKTK